jgi:acyl-CoA thioesterase-1
MLFKPNDHILFYGDSITDAGRDYENSTNVNLGSGYVMLCAAALGTAHPEWNLTITNKGIGGNRAYHLEERLEKDVLQLKPDLVSILIGINDVRRRPDGGLTSSPEEFAASYHRILTAIRANGAPKIAMLEPFLLPALEEHPLWRPALDPLIHACRDLAREFEVPYLPLDGIFAAASTRQTVDYWIPDGVHPSLAGHALITDHWLDLVTS